MNRERSNETKCIYIKLLGDDYDGIEFMKIKYIFM